MATSGSITAGPWTNLSSGYPKQFVLSWSLASQNVENNTSTINYNVVYNGGNSGWWVTTWDRIVNFNGSRIYTSSDALNTYQGTTITSGSRTVTHDANGNATIEFLVGGAVYARSDFRTKSGSWSLPTINRASVPSINTYPNNSPDFNLGDTITIHMNSKNSNFRHTVKINYGSTSYTISTDAQHNCTLNTSLVEKEICALIPNATSYSNTISVTTYSGSTNIGTKTCSYNAKTMASRHGPTFFNFSYSDDNQIVSSLLTTDKTYLQNHSIPKLIIDSSQAAKGNYSASITQYTAGFDGASKTINYSTGSISTTFSPPKESSSLAMSVTAIDSRGYSSTIQKTIPVIPYTDPTINASAERAGGFEAETTIKGGGTYSKIEHNNTTLNSIEDFSYRFKKTSETTWSNWTKPSLVQNAGSYSITNQILEFDNQYAWDIELKVTDKIKTITESLSLSVGLPILFVSRNKKVGINKKPTLGDLDIAGLAYSRGQPLMPSHVGQIIVSTTLNSASEMSAIYGGTWTKLSEYQLVAYASLSSDTAIASSKNISSITKTGTGTYRVNFSKTMANANYVAFVSGEVGGAGQEIVGVYTKSTTSFYYDFCNNAGTMVTPTSVNIAVFGTLATPEQYMWKRTA